MFFLALTILFDLDLKSTNASDKSFVVICREVEEDNFKNSNSSFNLGNNAEAFL